MAHGGAFPSVPQQSTKLPWPLNSIVEKYTQFLRRISYPIQNFFGRSDLAFRISLNAWLTPLWSKMANFKGQNERSARDIRRFLVNREKARNEKPLFLFLNLMETHLPFWPPGEFVDQVAPYMRSNKEARDIMRRWNKEAYRWAAPLEEPLGELESQVLNDMYDAEVAYQDNYLGPLFQAIQERANADNTLTIVVADHGDGLGEHGCFGHAFVAYEELVHVPLMINWPKRIKAGSQVKMPVSTRRIYHTILDAAGMLPGGVKNLDPAEIHGLTLMENVLGRDPEQQTAFAEVYPPSNFIKAIQHRQPEILEKYRCLAMRRAVVQNEKKLIHVGEWPDELFDLDKDPLEMDNIKEEHPAETAQLSQEINRLVRQTESQRENLAAGLHLDVEVDEHLLQRLRGLGYIE
jgi:uncharacterized sulfatase